MPRKPIGDRPMTDAERQARRRAARAAGRPAVRARRPADHRSRARRWHDTVADLLALQVEYEARLKALPDTLQDTATAEALRTISELDLSELQAIEPPRGFGRDLYGAFGVKRILWGGHRSRPNPRGGSIAWISARSRSQIACNASARELCWRLVGRASSQAAY